MNELDIEFQGLKELLTEKNSVVVKEIDFVEEKILYKPNVLIQLSGDNSEDFGKPGDTVNLKPKLTITGGIVRFDTYPIEGKTISTTHRIDQLIKGFNLVVLYNRISLTGSVEFSRLIIDMDAKQIELS